VEKSYKPHDINILVRSMVKIPAIILIGMAKTGFRFLKENHTVFPLATECKAII